MDTMIIATACGSTSSRAAQWLVPLDRTMRLYQIINPLDQAAFLAQIGYESAGLSAVEENLNYSAERLLAVFPSHFDQASALKYAGNPVAIGNRVYANRMGNGDESSGDGWKYRGRGLIQVTGHDNYLQAESDLGILCLDHPDLLLQKSNAADCAADYWVHNGLQELAIAKDIDGITSVIRGKINTPQDRRIADERIERTKLAYQAFGLTV